MSAFAVERDGRVAVVLFDLPGSPVNTLTTAVGEELVEVLDRLAFDDTTDAVVLISGKKDIFIAGADIDQFAALATAEDARDLSRSGQQMVERVAGFPKPLVAAIHGACLGGGLEVAMAARYRVATDAPATRIGLPEVQLGLIPAAGGCQRLPRLIGLPGALDMILTGKPATPARALRTGLVDEVVPKSILRDVAAAAASRLASGWRPSGRARRPLPAWLAARPPGRWVVLGLARRQAAKRTGGHYPAPAAAIDAIGRGLARGH
ncbi:MAG: enoyl-CoA hydratase-related protein, partial [Acidobacteria bacterium]|nr:enoyl-CoA hydratase-related protein [Acidobacteriota bacterium]